MKGITRVGVDHVKYEGKYRILFTSGTFAKVIEGNHVNSFHRVRINKTRKQVFFYNMYLNMTLIVPFSDLKHDTLSEQVKSTYTKADKIFAFLTFEKHEKETS